jgi:PEP-CTERM putative exosortase interaction domain
MSQSTFADSIRISEVVQTVRPTEGLVDLRINTFAQDPGSPDKGTVRGQSDKTKNVDQVITPTASLLGVEIKPQQQQVGVEVVGDAIVEGTVCDCGEILVPGGVPKWPLIFLAAIPFIFIHNCEDCDIIPTPTCLTCDTIVTPTPTPTPPNITTPEPATLFLFGSGLLAFGAGLRRRYSRSKLLLEKKNEDE